MEQHERLLLQRWAASRDAEAFTEIVTRYADLVYGTCRRVLGNETDAEGVAQECFLRLASRPGQARSSLGGWLYRLATRRSVDALRAASRRRKREARYVEEHQSATTDWDALQPYLDEAIESLPTKQRDAVVAHFLGRQTHDALARPSQGAGRARGNAVIGGTSRRIGRGKGGCGTCGADRQTRETGPCRQTCCGRQWSLFRDTDGAEREEKTVNLWAVPLE